MSGGHDISEEDREFVSVIVRGVTVCLGTTNVVWTDRKGLWRVI
jgi:hypothetical protein